VYIFKIKEKYIKVGQKFYIVYVNNSPYLCYGRNKTNQFTTQMEEAEFVGKVNRFGSEFAVYLNPVDNCIHITDENGIELKCASKKIKANEDVLDVVPQILRSVGL